MSETFNIYCDESCHLENDRQKVMVLGATWCPKTEVHRINRAICDIKEKHNAKGELKWSKVSPSRINFYEEIVDFFFKESDLNFRSLIVSDKGLINHQYFNQGSHDSFYYKMYYQMLLPILKRPNHYNIYLDIKDTRSAAKVRLLREVLCNTFYDYKQELIPVIQNVRSHELHLMQVADFLIGAISYRNRYEKATSGMSETKISIVNIIKYWYGRELVGSTPLWEEKFNLFTFTPRKVDDDTEA